jgi:hypothetical protein
MLKRAAVLVPLLVSLSPAAFADDAATAASPIVAAPGTVVVITPPVSVTTPLPPPEIDSVPEAQPPPQNEPWSNVSHINGVPVPVGERNRYLYDFKKTNLQLNPLGPLDGFYEIALSHALSANLAISVELAAESHDGANAEQIAVTLPIYFKRTFSGPYIEPGLVERTQNYDVDTCFDCGIASSASYTQFEMMVGWAWMFDSGLNMSAAFGAARQLGGTDGSYDDGLAPAGYFRAGYAF